MSTTPRPGSKVLLIGWDAADWKLIQPLMDAGKMPNLKRLIGAGSSGNIATMQPCLSPILWTSIATGKTPDKHNILGFIEPTPDGSGLRLSSSTSRTTKALWNILSQAGLRASVVGWYASHPAEPVSGVCVTNRFVEDPPADHRAAWKMPEGSVHPATMADKIARSRVHPGSVSPAELSKYIQGLKQIDLKTERRPGLLTKALAKMHSVHSAAAAILKGGNWDFLGVYYEAIDVVGHDFMPFHPPRLPHVSEQDFARYRGVMNELYEYHDQMLGRLLDLAGRDATVIVVSDHGFHSDHLRPQSWDVGHTEETQAAAWHRQFGMIAMSGPGVRASGAGGTVHGATLLDVAPTVLALFGLSAGKDMDGRVLAEALDVPSVPERIESWDALPGEAFMHGPDVRQDPYVSMQALQQLVDLGYMPPIAEDQKQAAETARAEAQFNLAASHMHHRRPAQAKTIAETLVQQLPSQSRYALLLARACFEAGEYAEAERILEAMEREGRASAESRTLLIAVLLQQEKTQQAIARIESLERDGSASANAAYLLGCALLTQGAHEQALGAFQRAVRADGNSAPYLDGAAQALIALGRHEEACDLLLRALELMPVFPQGHYHLGQALAALNETEHAMTSLRHAIMQEPRYADAHRLLADLLERTGDHAQAAEHRRLGG